MASMKECPSCQAEVPASAKRCKECFHDFDDAPKDRNWTGPVAILLALAGMVMVALITLGWIVMQPRDQHTFVDQGSQSIVWTRTYVTGTTTDRLEFKDVVRLEYVMYTGGSYEIAAVTADGTRKVVQEGGAPLKGDAEKFAKLMDKPLTEIDNTRGFGQK